MDEKLAREILKEKYDEVVAHVKKLREVRPPLSEDQIAEDLTNTFKQIRVGPIIFFMCK